jgi:hypothetical protein
MRTLTLLALAATVTACSTAPRQSSYSAQGEAKLQTLLAGKVAGPALDCLPTFRSSDMIRVDDDTVLFRDGPGRLYRSELNGACNGLGSPNYTLVTKSPGGRLCRGDMARMVDSSNGMTVGSCVMGDFVPYTRPRA